MNTREQSLQSLNRFKVLRDDLLDSDQKSFPTQLRAMTQFWLQDAFVVAALSDLPPTDVKAWLEAQDSSRRSSALKFPTDDKEALAVQVGILRAIDAGDLPYTSVGYAVNIHKSREAFEFLQQVITMPLCRWLGSLLEKKAEYAQPHERALHAVPLDRIPPEGKTHIFLSHKSGDKPMVERLARTLTALGHAPWLDSHAMRPGDTIHRGIAQGMLDSCAVVFFVTSSFADDRWLRSEIDHAIELSVERGNKFRIITLCFNQAEVPEPLRRHLYANVSDELEALHQIVRGLPIELGPVRWRREAVE